MEYVYLFKTKGYPFLKLGYSKKPKKRMETLQQNTPFYLEKWAEKEGDLGTERAINKVFQAQLWDIMIIEKGEWYRILPCATKKEAKDIKQNIIKTFKHHDMTTWVDHYEVEGETVLESLEAQRKPNPILGYIP